jgi:hypothetical protein
LLHFKQHIHVFFAKKYKIVRTKSNPILHIGRQASKTNRSRGLPLNWIPKFCFFFSATFSNVLVSVLDESGQSQPKYAFPVSLVAEYDPEVSPFKLVLLPLSPIPIRTHNAGFILMIL